MRQLNGNQEIVGKRIQLHLGRAPPPPPIPTAASSLPFSILPSFLLPTMLFQSHVFRERYKAKYFTFDLHMLDPIWSFEKVFHSTSMQPKLVPAACQKASPRMAPGTVGIRIQDFIPYKHQPLFDTSASGACDLSFHIQKSLLAKNILFSAENCGGSWTGGVLVYLGTGVSVTRHRSSLAQIRCRVYRTPLVSSLPLTRLGCL